MSKKTLKVNGVDMPLSFKFSTHMELQSLIKASGKTASEYMTDDDNTPKMLQLALKAGGNEVIIDDIVKALDELPHIEEVVELLKPITQYYVNPNQKTQTV